VLFKRKLACSFCGKSASQVAKLVAGHRGYICDVCAAEAHRIMSEWDPGVAGPTAPQSTSLGARIKRLLTRMSRASTPTRLLQRPA
jgi:ATP-dependent Clp protease ATP-binding subunit ClpX